MNLKTLLAAALLSCGTLVVAGCASHGHEHSAGEMMDDSTITTKVKSALLAEDDVKSFDIAVKTYDGDVQLSGFVNSQWQIDKAGQVAMAVKGVRHVSNDLIHKPK